MALAPAPASALVSERATVIGVAAPAGPVGVVNVVTTGATVPGSGILVAIVHDTAPAPGVAVADGVGAYVQRAGDLVANTNGAITVSTEVWARFAPAALPLGSNITVTFGGPVNDVVVVVIAVAGVFQSDNVAAGMLDISLTNTNGALQNRLASIPTALPQVISQTADELFLAILGSQIPVAPGVLAPGAPNGYTLLNGTNSAGARRVDILRKQVDRIGNAKNGACNAADPCRFVGTWPASVPPANALRTWSLVELSIRYAPSKVVYTAAPATFPASPPSCEALTIQTQNDLNEPLAPVGIGGTNTVVRHTSDSPAALFYSAGTCLGAPNQDDTYAQPTPTLPCAGTCLCGGAACTAPTTKNHFLQDTAAGNWTLTASRNSGPVGELITNGTSGYSVTGGGATQYLIAVDPEQVFTNGAGLSPATPSQIPVGNFTVVLYAVDGSNNLDTLYDSIFVDLEFSDTFAGGCAPPAYNGFTPPTPVSVIFFGGISEPVNVTVTQGGNITISALEVSADNGTGSSYPLSGSSAGLNIIANDTTGSLATTNSPVPIARANGEVTVSFVNSSANPITSVTLDRPDNTWSWAGSSNTCGLTPAVTASQITFSGSLNAGAPCTITGINSGNVYPNYGSTQNLTTGFNWSSCAGVPGPVALPVQVRIPVGPPLNPGVTRMQGRSTTVAFWSDSNVNQTAAGTLVLRTPNGTIPALPADKTVYGVGNILAPNSTVVCVAAAGAQTCTDANAGVLGSTSQYTLHQFDSANIYSRVGGAGLLVTAFPQPASTGGWFYARESFVSLAEPGVRPSNAGAPTSGFVAVPSNDLGVYMVRLNDASEQRRASRSINPIQRRVNPAVGTAFAGDIGPDGNLYAIPTSGTGNGTIVSASQTHLPTGLPVTGGVNQVLRASLPAAAQANYATDVMVFGSNSGSGGNFIQATPPSLGAPYWNFATGADQVTHEPYMDYARGFLFVPVGVGTGVFVFDLNVAGTPPGPGVYAANLTAQKLLNTRTFQAQCRKQQTGNVLFCGATNGDVVAIDLTNGNTLGTTNVGGSVQSISTLASSFNGDIIYTTRSGTIGRLNFTAGAFTGVWGPSTITGATVLSPATSVGSGLYVGANGPTTARLYKLNIGNGSVLDNRSLVSTGAVGAVGVDAFQNRLAATTAAGAIWSFPTF